MRTTIELTDEQRARLLALAARRRLRGYSPLIREVIERYLEDAADGGVTHAGAKAARAARRIRGSLSEADVKRMRRRIDELWKGWR